MRYAIALLISVAGLWLALLIGVAIARPRGLHAREMAFLMPDLIRMFHGLARDRSLPRRIRARLWLLLAFMASPIDLIPDVIPVIGFADDIILACIVLRSVVRAAGTELLHRHWPGSAAGLLAIEEILGRPTAGKSE